MQNVNIDRCRIEKSATYQSGLFLQILCKIILSIYPPKILCYSFATWKENGKTNPFVLSFFHESQSCFLNCFYMSSILINLQMEVSKWNKFPRFTADCFLFASPHSVSKSSKILILNFQNIWSLASKVSLIVDFYGKM